MAGNSEDTKKEAVLLNDSDSDTEKGLEENTGLLPSKLNLRPGKKLLVLNLGGLLCHRVCRKRKPAELIYGRADASYGSFVVYKRPHCSDFMKFCLERFEVAIWSSAREWYMNNALDCILVGLRNKVLFFWDQTQCTDSGFKSLEDKFKPIFLKQLDKIWDNKHNDLPSRAGQYSSKNSLLIDTNPYKALLNPPNTAIFPEDYTVKHVNDDALGPNGELRLYLSGLVDADDVPSYVESHSFGQPAITSAHPDWEFYSKIIRRHQR